jgi:hypothetical protein
MLILLRGRGLGNPSALQIHFAVRDLDLEVDRLMRAVTFKGCRMIRHRAGRMRIEAIQRDTQRRPARHYAMLKCRTRSREMRGLRSLLAAAKGEGKI